MERSSGVSLTSTCALVLALTVTAATGVRVAEQVPARANTSQARAAAGDPCAVPANAIVAENCKPGNPSSEWDINGYGDPSIQGFSTDMSVNPGETVTFKVKTDATAYRVDVYRLGYYRGLGARLVATVKPSVPLPQVQPQCKADYETRLYDCGTWNVSASWAVPSDAVSGIYIARLVRTDPKPGAWRADFSQDPAPKPDALPHAYGANGFGKLANAIREPRASHIVFVVRTDQSKSDILFQTSDPTWQAYNRYGLGNTYSGITPAGEGTGQANRAYKVSYNRPITNRETGSVNQVFNAEYPMVRFLEANGYDVTYFAGVDSDRYGDRIKQHKLFLSNGHDEYWSAGMRKSVEAARDSGVHLAFFSGNEVFWKIRFENSVDGSNTPFRTLVTYKETHTRIADDGQLQAGRKIDPMKNVWTGTWRDSSPFNPEGPQPENALTGTIFTVNAYRNDPLVVPGKYAGLRFWRNTDVAKLKPTEQLVLGKGILGHEWDEDLDNGFRPAGIVRLSETTVHGVMYLQDFGSTYDSGTATHHLTLYRAKSGAMVFGAGTVQWAWGLDDFHDNNTGVPANRANRYSIRVGVDQTGPVKALQQATVNLFADMGVQPTTLLPGLIPAVPSSDKVSPISKVVSPEPGSRLMADVIITGLAQDSGGGMVGGVEVSVDGGQTWHSAEGTESWTYQCRVPAAMNGSVTILSRAVDDSANLEMLGKGVTVRIGNWQTP
jgi:hypothetical protein